MNFKASTKVWNAHVRKLLVFPPGSFRLFLLILWIDTPVSICLFLTTFTLTWSLLRSSTFRLYKPLCQHANRAGSTWKIISPPSAIVNYWCKEHWCKESGQTLRCNIHSRVLLQDETEAGISLKSPLCLASYPSLFPPLPYRFFREHLLNEALPHESTSQTAFGEPGLRPSSSCRSLRKNPGV